MKSDNEKGPAVRRALLVQHATGQTHSKFSSGAVLGSTSLIPDVLFSRLEHVRPSGSGWTARCPAHADRNASLSVGVGNDGRLLVHCHAGCPIANVLAAIGMTTSDLFPRRLHETLEFEDDPHGRKAREHFRQTRRSMRNLAALAGLKSATNVLALEASVVLIAAEDVSCKKALPVDDLNRLALACERIRDARLALGGAR